jgi:toxin FitB
MNNIVDSSAWLEYFTDSKYAKKFAHIIENTKNLIMPSIIIYEVFKKVLKEKDEDNALKIAAHLRQGEVIDLDIDIALLAAKLSTELSLPMADSIILATARRTNSTIWTLDKDFKGIEGVKYFLKKE